MRSMETKQAWKAIFARGRLEHLLSNFNEARALYTRAHSLYRMTGDRVSDAQVIYRLGDLAHRSGQANEAHTYYMDALRIFQEEGNSLGQGHVLFRLAQLEKSYNPELAEQHFREAAGLYREAKNVSWRQRAQDEADALRYKKP